MKTQNHVRRMKIQKNIRLDENKKDTNNEEEEKDLNKTEVYKVVNKKTKKMNKNTVNKVGHSNAQTRSFNMKRKEFPKVIQKDDSLQDFINCFDSLKSRIATDEKDFHNFDPVPLEQHLSKSVPSDNCEIKCVADSLLFYSCNLKNLSEV
ncbi:hypothetical protein O3M35_012264 [Rhynocoris fuscipes]|uniref:Uncharacterized protein n=1 Tax=Rhynocoris fuscipes TaxID=488301 RepID=A0AAW1CRR7_9HEMI